MNAASFGDVVRSLLLREVGNVAGHGSGNDEASSAAFLEMVAHSLGTVKGTREIGLDNLVPVVDGAVKDTAIGSAASVGNERINLGASKSAIRPLIGATCVHTLPKSLITSATNVSALW